jgi:hypothetical protein
MKCKNVFWEVGDLKETGGKFLSGLRSYVENCCIALLYFLSYEGHFKKLLLSYLK